MHSGINHQDNTMTESQIEISVERMTDSLDRRFSRG
jgi:hypothetical protein